MDTQKEVSLSQIANIEKFSTAFSRLEDDYIFAHLTSENHFPRLTDGPLRINGLQIILCLSGHVELDVNLDTHILTSNMLMAIGPDSLINIKKIEWDCLDAYVFVISPEFIRDINLDINLLNRVRVTPPHNPVMTLETAEMKLLRKYFDLIHYNTMENPETLYVRSIARCLISAAVYQVMQFVRKHFDSIENVNRPLSRRSNYVSDFMQLVYTHHTKERSVAFYAAKLFISPKYLSLIIKEATGRSAAEWIDAYVLLEAKNMLRFSGKNVQQIAYELNFTNQSSFGKYFKHLTGMSPTEFQKS